MSNYPPPPGEPNPALNRLNETHCESQFQPPQCRTTPTRVGPASTRPTQAANGPRLHIPKDDPLGANLAPEHPSPKADVGPNPSDSKTDAIKTAALQLAIERAKKGDESALPELRELLAGIPSDQTGGNLGNVVVNQMLNVQFKTDLFAKEVVTRKLEELRQSLAGPKPTPVETLLIDRVVCCWLRLHLAEISAGPDEVKAKPLSPAVSRSLERYHKQYLSSLKALADLRKMNIIIQLNVARRQSILNKANPDR